MKILYTFVICAFFSCLLSAQVITSSIIKPPALLRCNEVSDKLNNIVFGSVPPNSENNPVIVFVHGWFDNGYSWFMAKNEWYKDAYNAGYKTAFFFQSYSDAFEDNGRVVADMVRETCKHYNTDRVIAVCHSKGGYDMEYALYNSNIWDSVQGVITLSTPFWGAPMSDMISIPLIRAFLESVPIVGPIFQGKGSYQMQTAYMAGVVRPMMDNHPDNRPEKFHCFATWGMNHVSVFPDAIPDDIIKVVFKDYQPLCIEIPGSGTLAGNLISGGMQIIGNLSHLVQVQNKYNNPQKNQTYIDGLAPYYSSIRPGSMMISEPPPSQKSYLNHVDAVMASSMWGFVQPEIEYFKNHPVLRKKNTPIIKQDEVVSYQQLSDLQLIQTNSLTINTSSINKLYVAGNYTNEKINVMDDGGQMIKTIPVNFSTQAMFDIFHEIDLTSLPANKKYTLQCSTPLVGFFQDGNKASIQLDTHSDKTYYADEPLSLEVTLNDWTDNIPSTTVKGFLNRNINENGDVIHDKMIPVTFFYDAEKQVFVCSDKLALEDGVYNLSVYVEGTQLKRFATTSILMKQERRQTKQETNLSVYPNPANNVFTVQFTSTENTKYTIELFDIIGKKIMEKDISGNISGIQQVQLSVKDQLSKGSYLISLVVNGERKATKVVVVN